MTVQGIRPRSPSSRSDQSVERARTPSILVVGANSRIGRALRPVLDPEGAKFVARRSADDSVVSVDRYEDIGDALLSGIDVLVCCIGISRGSTAELRAVNVDIVMALARAAKRAGVRRFLNISSFSVYGGAEAIDAGTPERPDSAYGQSKLEIDRSLASLATDRFETVTLRLPAVVSPGNGGKVARFMRFCVGSGTIPVPPVDIERSMISAGMAAAVLARLIVSDRTGIILAADPVPFNYTGLVKAGKTLLSRPLRPIPVPNALLNVMQHLFPTLYRSMYRSSRLAKDANFASQLNYPSDLYETIFSDTAGERR